MDDIEYYLVHQYSFPFEIKLNGVVIENEYENGMNGAVNMNYYILNYGKQRIEVKLIHPFIVENGLIKPIEIAKIKSTLLISKKDTILSKKELHLPKITQPVPYIEYEWEFEADLPFELEGWKNSEDLSKWDKNELEKQVLAKFTQLRSLLQTGDGAGFVKELAFANKEYFTANYFSEAQQQEYTANLIQTYSDHKGIMPLIENYRVRIMGDGKVVTLENLGKHRGQGVLTAEFLEEETLFQNYVMLHKPTNSDHFEIVRVNSQMTSIDE
ncbi:MAG: hypothetical protein JKY08_08035 [Flavobacteriaceae bacterium]|nr:hypothetical protein [Flavobacteriaceae bacterium]